MTFRSQIEPSLKSYECFMNLRNFGLEITQDWWIIERPPSFFNLKTHVLQVFFLWIYIKRRFTFAFFDLMVNSFGFALKPVSSPTPGRLPYFFAVLCREELAPFLPCGAVAGLAPSVRLIIQRIADGSAGRPRN